MTKSIWQTTIVNNVGDIQPNSQIEIRLAGSGSLVTVYADRAGSEVKGNPFQADGSGYAFGYLNPGRYNITATSGEFEHEWVDVLIFEENFGVDALFGPRRITGFIPSPVLAADRTASAITFSPGTYWDGTTLYTLESPLTKLANVAFAPGNNAGGIHALSEYSHVSCHLIINGSGNLDVCLTGSVTGSPVPDGFTHLTRLVSFTTYSTYYADIVNKTLPLFNAFEEPDGSILIQYGYDGENLNPAIISDHINPGTGVKTPTKGSNLIQTPLQSTEYLVLAYLEDATASAATTLQVWGGNFTGNENFRLGGAELNKTSGFAELLIPAAGGGFAFAQTQCWLRPPLFHKLSSSTADHRVILRKIAIRDRRLD